jgi:hypothetical protein
MNLEEALNNFGIALGNLKRAYAEEYSRNPNYVEVHIDESDYVTIYPTDVSGSYFDAHREWVNTDEE